MNLQLSLPLAGALLFIASGPGHSGVPFLGRGSLTCRSGRGRLFANLIPVFTAILSTLVLAELPHVYHGVAFLLIVGGIVVSSRR
jgi:drug/metabolite transporter (DMT)-like permease